MTIGCKKNYAMTMTVDRLRKYYLMGHNTVCTKKVGAVEAPAETKI